MALVKGTNSYSTVAEANTYFTDSLLFTSWNPLALTVKSRALITASGQISLLVKADCKLPIDVINISAHLANATMELALQMALDPSVITQSNTGSDNKRVKAGSVEVEFFRSRTSSSRFPSVVMNLLIAGDCLDSSTSGGSGGAEAFGTSEESTFTNRDEYGLTDGYA